MESFNEEHSKLLLSKEWLAKIDSQNSTPYLMKFYCSAVDLCCCILITDTKSTWFEVLTSNQFARRWRECNDRSTTSFLDEEEDAWRTSHIELLSKAHTLGGMADLTFEIVDTNYADLAFRLECNSFKWRWETVFVGHKLSAELLSKHLIMPLISVNHLAFSSPDAIINLTDSDLEKATDKVGRTARRTLDTHIRNALSKPRFATTLRRMTAMFNFIVDLPGIMTDADKPDLHLAGFVPKERPTPEHVDDMQVDVSENKSEMNLQPPSQLASPAKSSLALNSATESEGEAGPSGILQTQASQRPKMPSRASDRSSIQPVSVTKKSSLSPPPKVTYNSTKQASSDSGSSPVRPIKKAKPIASSSDEDSEAERIKRAKRGTRQPLNRGKKRF
ncbi:hypothetical protein BJ138DRAFT_1171717 [Hygrophoropsis aurantiaca]|uniref:Uncharacterized protein n=1 Tax=Hygrophoropsis aurantiaca TaxID=72124 RepID=A0ACB8AJA0_9AGAM|nr:hypothetical protein BJ138DRAFT_1171717 [Hygrophoropsis aurantiaca]